MTLKECYRILGVASTANLEDIKRAYRRRAFELHPDLNPNLVDASRQFQLLNEAYVSLTRILSGKEESAGSTKADQARQEKETRQEEARQKAKKEAEADATRQSKKEENDNQKKAKEEARQQARTEKEHKAQEEAAAKTKAKAEADAEKTRKTEAQERKRREAGTAYSRQEEVLSDILNDQFARRVFEDIYSEINKKQAQAEAQAEQKHSEKPRKQESPPTPKKLNVEWGSKVVNVDLTNGVTGAMRSWLRRQIDDELTVRLPRAKLFPGARVRLQIRQGIKQELRVVEVTLPPDFRTGKPIRLKGMGKKVGKWIGDLYLIIEPQQ